MRKLAIAAVAVLALLFVADLIARNVAESKLAEQIDAHESVQGSEVDIHGWSFLLQAARSTFGEVDVSLPVIQTKSGLGRELQVEDVQMTLHDLTVSDMFSKAVADRVVGTGTVPYEQLNQILGLEFGFDADSDGLRVTLPRLGVSATVSPGVDENGELTLGGAQIPGPLSTLVRQEFGFTGIPAELEVTAVKPTAAGLQVRLLARDVAFTR